jgi:hypothetical protein
MSEFLVTNYIYINGENTDNAKRIRRKLKKTNVNTQTYNIKNYNDNLIKTINNHVKYNKKLDYMGFITDNNVIIHNITRLPPVPKTWDILCCEADVSLHRYTNELNNVYWCNTEINDSRHIIFNLKSKSVLDILKKESKWSDFIKDINKECKIFTITQHPLSERYETHIQSIPMKFKDLDVKAEKIKEYNIKCKEELLKLDIPQLSPSKVTELINEYDIRTNNLSYQDKYQLLPSISIVCIPSSSDLFFHSLHAFLQLDYPNDKLQFIIIDTCDLERKIKQYLPEDSRIKLINISQKSENSEYTSIPIGYKLNVGCKYAENDLVFNMVDTNSYFISNFKNLVKAFIMSENVDVIISNDSSSIVDNKSYIDNVPSIKNMLYTKKFWEVVVFEEMWEDEHTVLYNFFKNKTSMVTTVPFIYFSVDYCSKNVSGKLIDFNLEKLIDENIKSSYKTFI